MVSISEPDEVVIEISTTSPVESVVVETVFPSASDVVSV